MKFDTIVIHRFTWWEFWYDVILSRWRPCRHFTQHSAPHGDCIRNVCPAYMQQRPPVPDPWYIRSFPGCQNLSDLVSNLSFWLPVSWFPFFTARCTIVQSAVLRLHVVCPSVTLVDQDHISWWFSTVVTSLAHQQSYSTPGPVSTWIGDRLWAGKPCRYTATEVYSAFYPPWDGKMSISFGAE